MNEDIKYSFSKEFVESLLTGICKDCVNYNTSSDEFMPEERRCKMLMMMEVIRIVPAFSESEYIKGYIKECYQSDRKASEFLENCEENCLKQLKQRNMDERKLTHPFFGKKTKTSTKIALIHGIVETLVEMHKEEEKRIEKERTATIVTTAAEKNVRIQGWKDRTWTVFLTIIGALLIVFITQGEVTFLGKTYVDFKQPTIQTKQNP